jgi:hypothetical protein
MRRGKACSGYMEMLMELIYRKMVNEKRDCRIVARCSASTAIVINEMRLVKNLLEYHKARVWLSV